MRWLFLCLAGACTSEEPRSGGPPGTTPTVPAPGTVWLDETVPEPPVLEISPPGGTFTGSLQVEISSSDPDLQITWSADGTPVTEASTPYSGPFQVTESTWLVARGFRDGIPTTEPVSAAWLALDADVADFDSNLALVVIDTFGTDVDDGSKEVFYPAISAFIELDAATGRAALQDPAQHVGYAGMHIRGQSTLSYPKRQYRFETRGPDGDDLAVSLLGLPEEGDWILHAPFSDKTLMRNHLIYKWSRDIGRYAVRTRFFELFLSDDGGPVGWDDYRGVYVLMERIERDGERVDIARLTPTDIEEPEVSGGYLLKKDWPEPGNFFTTGVLHDQLTYVDPPVEDLVVEQIDWLQAHFDAFEAALTGPDYTDPALGYAPWIDVDSFVDHHLLVEMARNVDGFVLSTYLHKDRSGPITMGPIWDYNGSLGNADYFCAYQVAGWHHEFNGTQCGEGPIAFPEDNPQAYLWYQRLFTDPAFTDRYAELWNQHRAGPLATDALLADIAAVEAQLTDGGAADSPVTRNFARWPVLNTYVWPNHLCCGTYEEHVDWLEAWLSGRVEWMDGELQ